MRAFSFCCLVSMDSSTVFRNVVCVRRGRGTRQLKGCVPRTIITWNPPRSLPVFLYNAKAADIPWAELCRNAADMPRRDILSSQQAVSKYLDYGSIEDSNASWSGGVRGRRTGSHQFLGTVNRVLRVFRRCEGVDIRDGHQQGANPGLREVNFDLDVDEYRECLYCNVDTGGQGPRESTLHWIVSS